MLELTQHQPAGCFGGILVQKRTIRPMIITIVMGFVALTAIKAMAIDAPVMTAEPKYTAGATNTVAFTLPAEAVEVEVWQDGDNDPSNGGLQSWTSQDVPLPTQATFSGAADTLYYYYVRCKDAAGNWSGWSNIVSSMQHCSGPVFGNQRPAPNGWTNMDVFGRVPDNPAISIPVFDPIGIDPGSVKMAIDGIPVNDAAFCSWHQAIECSPLGWIPPDGPHTLSVSIRDLASAPVGLEPHLGNESSMSWTFKIDTVAPQPPSTLVVPALVTSRTPTFQLSGAFDANSGIARYQVEMRLVGSVPPMTYSHLVNVDGDGPISTTVPDNFLPLSDNVYKVEVYSWDRAGNMSTVPSMAAMMTVDVVGPSQPNQLIGPSGQCWNDTTPEFTWSGAKDFSGIAGYQVVLRNLRDNLTRIYNLNCTADSVVWSVPEALPDGSYVLQVWSVDNAGHKSPQPRELQFIIDTTAPTMSGTIQGQAATNIAQPTFSWQAATDATSGIDHYTVTIKSGETVVRGPFAVPATSDLFTAWTVPAEGALSQEGIYSITVECTDKAGNPSSNSMTFEFVLDKTSPESQQITLAPYTNSRTPYLSWSQATPGNAFYSVEIWYEGQRVWGPVRAESTGVKVSDTVALPEDGSYELRVWTVDQAGNASLTYAAASFIVDTICPDPVLRIEGPSFTNDRNPSFVLSGARDGGSGVEGYKINVRDQSSQYYQWSSTSSTEWSVQGSLPRDGQYYVRVWAIDRAGNQSTTCATYSFVLDTVGPVMAGPVQGQSFTNNPQPAFTWSGASDTGSGVGGFEVTIKRDSTVVQNFKVPGSDGQAAWTIPAEGALTQEGAYTISVQCVDKAGNYSLDSLAFAFAFDTTSPAPPSLHYYPSCTNIRTPTFRWSQGTDNLTSVVRYSVQLWRDGACVRGPVEVNSPQVTLDDIVALSGEGQYELRVWSIDGAGNVSQTCASGSFLVDTTLPAPPAKVEGPAFTKYGDPSFTCSGGSDGGSGLGKYYIEVHKQTGEMVQSFWAGTEWTMSPMLAQDGQYEVRVWTQDRAGNRSETYVSCSFVLDSAAPAMVGPIEGQQVTSNTKPTFSWPSASDAGSGVDYYQVKLKLGTQELHDPYTVPASVGTVTWTLPSDYSLVESGVYTVEVRCADRAGNISSTISFQFTLDAAPPGLPHSLSVPYWTNSRTISISWEPVSGGLTEIVGYSVGVWRDGTIVWGPVRVTSESATVSVPNDGSYEFRLWSIDEMGSSSSTYVARSFNVDTVPPDPPSRVNGPAYVNTGTPTFTCSGPESGGYSGFRVDVCRQSGELVQSFQTTNFQWAIPTALPDGQYELKVWTFDGAGNESTSYFKASFVVDTAAPDAPEKVEGPAFINNRTPSFVCSGVVDNGSGLDSYYIEVHKQSGEMVQSFLTPGAQWTIPAPLTQDGQYEVRVWSNDQAGNRSKTYTSFSFVLDTVAPAMAGPIQGLAATKDRCPTFSWPGASDNASGLDHYAVTIKFGETVIHSLIVAAGTGLVTWTVPQENALIADGWYTITAEAVDRAGNQSQSSVLTFRLVTVRPTVTILTPASGGTYSINESSTLWARVSGEFVSAQIRVDGGEWTNVTKVMADGAIFHFFSVPLTPGTHTIELKVSDSLGNETTAMITIIVSGERKGFGFGRFSFPSSGQ